MWPIGQQRASTTIHQRIHPVALVNRANGWNSLVWIAFPPLCPHIHIFHSSRLLYSLQLLCYSQPHFKMSPPSFVVIFCFPFPPFLPSLHTSPPPQPSTDPVTSTPLLSWAEMLPSSRHAGERHAGTQRTPP